MLPAWGFEELTIRRGWAGFAERLAKAGYCCLRFDWPGAGDSIGDTKAGISLADWLDAVKAAANVLTERYSLERVVLVGHGVGGCWHPTAPISCLPPPSFRWRLKAKAGLGFANWKSSVV